MNSFENQYRVAVYCCRNNMNQKYTKLTDTGIIHMGDVTSFLCVSCHEDVRYGCPGPIHCDTITAEVDEELLLGLPEDSKEMQELKARIRDEVYDDVVEEIEKEARKRALEDAVREIETME